MSFDEHCLNNEVLARFGTRDGPNCAESVLMYGIKCMNLDAPDDILRIATPFGGGMGRCEDICGALTGGAMLIGLKYGRKSLDGDKLKTYAIVKEFFNWFKCEFGSINCMELNYSDFFSQDHRDRCGSFVTKTVKYLDSLFEKIDKGEWNHNAE